MITTSRISVGIILKDGSSKEIQANAIPLLTKIVNTSVLKEEVLSFLKNSPLKDLTNLPKGDKSEPDILIGIDNFWEFLDQNQIIQLPSGFHLVESLVGLLVAGKQTSNKKMAKETEGSRCSNSF